MALGELTRQLAQQALGNQMKDVLDPKPAAPVQPENIGVTLVGQVQAMQTALKDDQELVILNQVELRQNCRLRCEQIQNLLN